jgi:flagellar biosynthesis/type III secretory pathway protein FliH
LSNVIRGEAVALGSQRAGRPVTLPRIFGGRVLRGDHVGIQRPVPLAPPVITPDGANQVGGDLDRSPPPAPPDLAQIEEAARVQGYNAGFEQGYAAATAAVDETMGQSVRRLAALVSSVHENHSAFFRAAERQVVDLALQIAQKVVEREIENMPDLAVNVVRGALEEMDARTAVRVRVNPEDVELLRRRWAQVVPPGISPERIELQADERVRSGGAVIETTHGQVDAQLESKLAQLGNTLWTLVMDVDSAQESDSPEGAPPGMSRDA